MVKARPAAAHRQPASVSAQLKVFLVQLLQQRPLIFWGSVWAIALLLISGSIATLLDPTASRPGALHELVPPPQPLAAPSPTAPELRAAPLPPSQVSAEAVPAIERGQPAVPYRSLAAIVLGCGLGSVLISWLLNSPSKSPPHLHAARPSLKQHSAVRPPACSAQPSPPLATPYAMPPTLTTPRTAQRPASSRTAEPVVTIVAAETSHALDWDEASLVNAMDLRKRRSLSSWL